jgi:hypothetical protein
MITPDEIPRRGFLRAMSLGTTLIGAGGLLEGCATQAPLLHEAVRTSPSTAPRRTTWDMSWVARLTRPHRVVFDVTKISDGDALWQTTSWMQGYAEAEGATDADLNAVLVFRHSAVAMVLSDEMWARLDPGGARPGQTAPTTTAPATAAKRNPYLGEIGAPPPPTNGMQGRVTIRRLMSRGVIMLACNNALNGQAYSLKQKEGLAEADAQAQVRTSVAEGVYVMPNGIFSVARAQEAGCSLFMPG